jgi:hypothetical protein
LALNRYQLGKPLYSPLRVFGGSCIAIGGEWVLGSRHGTEKRAPELLAVSSPAPGKVVYQVEEAIPAGFGEAAAMAAPRRHPRRE